MKKTTLLFFVIFSLFCSCVFAENFVFDKDSIVELNIPCFENDSSCNPSVNCNISITYPVGTSFVNNEPMIKTDIYYSYTLPDSSVVGVYKFVVLCSDNVNNGYTSYSFEIIPAQSDVSVKELSVGKSILILALVLLYGILLIFGIFSSEPIIIGIACLFGMVLSFVVYPYSWLISMIFLFMNGSFIILSALMHKS